MKKTLTSFKTSEVRKVFRHARIKEKFKGLELFLAPSLLEYGRILVVTPRKSGNAPQRNLIRRRLKAIFKEHAFAEKKVDCIIIVRKEGINTSFKQLEEFLTSRIALYEDYQHSRIST